MNFDCTDSEKFYELNRILGFKEETSTEEITNNELTPISSNENSKARPSETLNDITNKEKNQRFKPIINNYNRISTPSATIPDQILNKTTTNALTNAINTEKTPQTTSFREFSSIADRNSLLTTTLTNDLIPSTTYPPINIAQFFELTTRKSFNYPTATLKNNLEYSTDLEQSTKTNFVPDLYENINQSKTDEIVDSIKQLQRLTNGDESREKRVLLKSDSVKNRQKLFEMLNHH